MDRILHATSELLSTNTANSITTTLIAKKAKVNVATLYQFFPNKQAIFYALYQKWLAQITAGYDEVERLHFGTMKWREFFKKLRESRVDTALNAITEINLDYLMESNEELAELEKYHANEYADRMVRYLKAYGSTWSNHKLKNFSLLLYEIGWAATHRIANQSRKNILDIHEWTMMAYLSLIESCLHDQH